MTEAAPPAIVMITMAGFGHRFRDAGFDCPKYMIKARGRSLFDWSIGSLERHIAIGSPFVFIVRREDAAEDFIRGRAAAFGISQVEIVSLETPTDGQATTARVACELVDRAAPLAIFNIDTSVEPYYLNPAGVRGDGFIPCFDAPGDSWSFVRLGADGYAVEVREKQRISGHASVGYYWFRSVEIYAAAYDRYYRPGRPLDRGERYVAPIYNSLIEDGYRVTISNIPCSAIRLLGTPEQLDAFVSGRTPG